MASKAEKNADRESKAVAKADEKRYYEEAKTWEAEMFRSARGRARGMTWVAGISLMLVFLSIMTLMAVMPLKETVPYVIEVDRVSGIVEIKKSITDVGISESEAITKFFIVEYLTAREAYMYARAQQDYVKVQKMSTPTIATDYYEWFQPNNEQSPLNVYGKNGTVELQIRNVSFIDKNTVTVPIKRIENKKGQKVEKYDVVTLSYRYLQDPATEEDRFINPLGFQVTAYRKDPQLVEE